MVYGEPVEKPWTAKDRNLLEAYQILEDEKCPECGSPIWLCRNDDPNVRFRVRSAICYGKREMDEHRTDIKNMKPEERKKARAQWGKIEWPEAFTEDEGPLPTRREFFEKLAEKNSTID